MRRTHRLLFSLAGGLLVSSLGQAACTGTPVLQQADLAGIQAFVQARQRQVLSFAGYSGAGYQDEAAMLALAGQVLDGQDPAQVMVNIGATAEGIGAVYALARWTGFRRKPDAS